MKSTVNTTAAATADALAANFQVAELEPRLENAWAGHDPEPECPSKDEPL